MECVASKSSDPTLVPILCACGKFRRDTKARQVSASETNVDADVWARSWTLPDGGQNHKNIGGTVNLCQPARARERPPTPARFPVGSEGGIWQKLLANKAALEKERACIAVRILRLYLERRIQERLARCSTGW